MLHSIIKKNKPQETKSKTSSGAIGILGGTFDPIHQGHIAIAREALQHLKLSEIRFIPCYKPAHKNKTIANAEQRLEMVKLALKNKPGFVVDDCEYQRETPSITIDTLRELRAKFPTTPLCLIIGMDSLITFPTWDHFQEILNLAHLVVMDRPNYALPATGSVADLVKKHQLKEGETIHTRLAGRIYLCPFPLKLDMSSSFIRKNIALGNNPHYFLSHKVSNYIEENHLYHNETNQVRLKASL